MELILKPTSKCNFACTFCSANKLNLFHFQHVSDKLKDLLLKINPSTIILTGGDPLTVDPSFYDELLNLGSWSLSFTTNLKDFYLSPINKWYKIFKNPRVRVCTSFQYGISRKWDNDQIYTEELFKKVYYKFCSIYNYPLMFISVISNENEHLAIKHVELAKTLNTKCKLNGLMPLGAAENNYYPLYKMIDIWLKIKDLGLEKYHDNYTSLYHGGCNLNINRLCKSTIRAIQFYDNDNYKITSCEDDLVQNDIESIPNDKISQEPIKENISDTITSECIFCELFYVCNGCHQNRKINKLDKNFCSEMKLRKDKILNSGWKIQ